MKEYNGYYLRNYGDIVQVCKLCPYDDAEYFWARSKDEYHWDVIHNGKIVKRNFIGCFEKVADFLEHNNKSIKPIMVHY